MKSSKGVSKEVAVSVIVGFMMVLTIMILIVPQMAFLGGSAGQEGDVTQLNELSSDIKSRCSDSNTEDPISETTEREYEFQRQFELSIDNSNEDGEMQAEFQDNVASWDLGSCEYSFTVDGATGGTLDTSDSNFWYFEIQATDTQEVDITACSGGVC